MNYDISDSIIFDSSNIIHLHNTIVDYFENNLTFITCNSCKAEIDIIVPMFSQIRRTGTEYVAGRPPQPNGKYKFAVDYPCPYCPNEVCILVSVWYFAIDGRHKLLKKVDKILNNDNNRIIYEYGMRFKYKDE